MTEIDFAGNKNMGKDDDAMEALFTAISEMPLTLFDLSDSGYTSHCLDKLSPRESKIGANGIKQTRFKESKFKKSIAKMKLDTTGDMENQRTYTLEKTQTVLDLKYMYLGSEDLQLIAMWMSKPEVANTLTRIEFAGCPVTDSRRPKMEDLQEAQGQVSTQSSTACNVYTRHSGA